MQTVKINRKLNIVIPLDTDAGTIYIHSMPIAFEVFDKYRLPLARTFAAIYKDGYDVIVGPRVAANILREVAQTTPGASGYLTLWEGPDGVENGLMAEIRRLTNVVVPSENGGWTTVMFHDVITRTRGTTISREDISDVENALVFFTVASWLHRGPMREATLASAASLWGAELTSFSDMEYARSLETSTGAASSGATVSTS